MAIPMIAVLAAGGGIAYVAAQEYAESDAPIVPVPRVLNPPSGSTITQAAVVVSSSNAHNILLAGLANGSIKGKTVPAAKNTLPASNMNYRIPAAGSAASVSGQIQSGWKPGGKVDPELAKKAKQIEDYAQKVHDDMNEVAKGESAEYLNKELKLDPPLNGHEDWKDIAARVGAVAGGAAGTAICGPICGLIGAWVGAYLGGEVGDWLAKNWDEIEAWGKARWGDVKGAVYDAYDEVPGWIGI